MTAARHLTVHTAFPPPLSLATQQYAGQVIGGSPRSLSRNKHYLHHIHGPKHQQAWLVPAGATATATDATATASGWSLPGEEVARTLPRPGSRSLRAEELAVLLGEAAARELLLHHRPPCAMVVRLQVVLDGRPLGPQQLAQLSRWVHGGLLWCVAVGLCMGGVLVCSFSRTLCATCSLARHPSVSHGGGAVILLSSFLVTLLLLF